MKTSVKLKSKYTINKIHEILCQTVDSGYDIETQGSSVLCRISLKTMRILRLYEFWDKVKITKDKHGESWFEVPFSNNRQSYMYNNLKRYETIEKTYGFKEVTISTHALLKNIWVIAEYKRNPDFHFEWIAVTVDGLVIAEFADEKNKKMYVCIDII